VHLQNSNVKFEYESQGQGRRGKKRVCVSCSPAICFSIKDSLVTMFLWVTKLAYAIGFFSKGRK